MTPILPAGPLSPAPSTRPESSSTDPVAAAFAAEAADPTDRSGAHLMGLALRLGSPPIDPETPAPARPEGPGHTWTLGETLAEIRRRGARLTRTSRGVRLAHAHRLPELARAIDRHREAIDLSLAQGPVPSPFDAPTWDDETRLYAAWLAGQPPESLTRVALRPGHVLVDGRAFVTGVAERLAAGPNHPGAEGLRADLAGLFARIGGASLRRASAPVRRALAA